MQLQRQCRLGCWVRRAAVIFLQMTYYLCAGLRMSPKPLDLGLRHTPSCCFILAEPPCRRFGAMSICERSWILASSTSAERRGQRAGSRRVVLRVRVRVRVRVMVRVRNRLGSGAGLGLGLIEATKLDSRPEARWPRLSLQSSSLCSSEAGRVCNKCKPTA